MINKEQDFKEKIDAIGRTHVINYLHNQKNQEYSRDVQRIDIDGMICITTFKFLILVKTAIEPNEPPDPTSEEITVLKSKAEIKIKKPSIAKVIITQIGSPVKVVLSELPSESEGKGKSSDVGFRPKNKSSSRL